MALITNGSQTIKTRTFKLAHEPVAKLTSHLKCNYHQFRVKKYIKRILINRNVFISFSFGVQNYTFVLLYYRSNNYCEKLTCISDDVHIDIQFKIFYCVNSKHRHKIKDYAYVNPFLNKIDTMMNGVIYISLKQSDSTSVLCYRVVFLFFLHITQGHESSRFFINI